MQPKFPVSLKTGGGERIRTDDPLLAKQVLSQLSYTPDKNVVGLDRLELSTSRLSGVRSNHLSYRPAVVRPASASHKPGGPGPAHRIGAAENLAGRDAKTAERRVLRKLRGVSCQILVSQEGRRLPRLILRKEVIQPQVPLRLPCYDFTPVADLTVDGCLPCGLAHRLQVKPTPMV